MNRKILAVAGGIMILGVMAGIMLCLLRNLSVSYECKVDFLYADSFLSMATAAIFVSMLGFAWTGSRSV